MIFSGIVSVPMPCADAVISGSCSETGVVEQVLAGGEALVRYPGGKVLLTGALPGETVTFKLDSRHRGVMRGQLLSVESPSLHRIAVACPVADPIGKIACGGCALQGLAASEHAQLKLEWVSHHFAPLLDDSVAVGWLPGAPSVGAWQQRRRVRWHVAQYGSAIVIGFRSKRSHQVLCGDGCCVVTSTLGKLRRLLQQAMQAGDLPLLSTITATQLNDGIHLLLEGAQAESAIPPLDEVDHVPLQWWWQREGRLWPWNRPVQKLHDSLPAACGGDIAVEVGVNDFVQADCASNRALMRWLVDQAQTSRRVVDLFCGVGNFSLPLALPTRTIVGADSNASAVACANRTAARLGVAAEYHTVDLFHNFDLASFVGADLLLLDPPRKGARRVVAMMGQLLPRKVVMMHCDPASGGRDGQMMVQQGYQLKALYALDMFAWSGHVEAISVWQQCG